MITLTTRVLPQEDQDTDPARVAASGLARLTEDLQHAIRLSSVSATSITVQLADRTGDGVAESVTYSWSGTAGAPLIRTYNLTTTENIVQNVRSVAFTADTFAAARTSAGAAVEGSEQLLEEYNPSSTGSGGGVDVTSLSTPGLYVQPALPADATSWRPTRILIKADKETGGRTTTLNIRKVDTNRRPVLANLWSTGATNTSADNQTWRTISLSSLPAMSAGDGLAFLLATSSLTASTKVYPDTGVLTPHGAYVLTTNSGLSWTFTRGSAFPFRLYGCVTRPTTTSTSYNRVDRIEVRLKVNSDSAAELRTSIALSGRPEIG